MDYFQLFIHQHTDKRQSSICMMSKRWTDKENCLCFHFPFDVSMYLCLHVSMSPCLYAAKSPFLHVSMSPCLCLHVSMSPSPCPFLYFTGIPQKETEQIENGNFSLFASNRKGKCTNFCLFAANWNVKPKIVFLGLQMMNGIGRLLFQRTCPSMLKSFKNPVKNKRRV